MCVAASFHGMHLVVVLVVGWRVGRLEGVVGGTDAATGGAKSTTVDRGVKVG
jgi:hypothetical protein